MFALLQIHITPGDERPIYRQIIHQVLEAIASGRLRPGDRLPSHRELAQALVIAPLTVKRSYDELARSGYIQMGRGQGTFIRNDVQELKEEDKKDRLRPLVKRLIQEAVLLNIDLKSLQSLMREEQKTIESQRKQTKEKI
jgi:GntR family transcriptional regulator